MIQYSLDHMREPPGRCAQICPCDDPGGPRGAEPGPADDRDPGVLQVPREDGAAGRESGRKRCPTAAAQVDAGIPAAPGDRPDAGDHPPDERGLRDRAMFDLGLMTLRISSAFEGRAAEHV